MNKPPFPDSRDVYHYIAPVGPHPSIFSRILSALALIACGAGLACAVFFSL